MKVFKIAGLVGLIVILVFTLVRLVQSKHKFDQAVEDMRGKPRSIKIAPDTEELKSDLGDQLTMVSNPTLVAKTESDKLYRLKVLPLMISDNGPRGKIEEVVYFSVNKHGEIIHVKVRP